MTGEKLVIWSKREGKFAAFQRAVIGYLGLKSSVRHVVVILYIAVV